MNTLQTQDRPDGQTEVINIEKAIYNLIKSGLDSVSGPLGIIGINHEIAVNDTKRIMELIYKENSQ